MRKKWHILFRRELGTPSCKPSAIMGADYERAKELYYKNFANHMTMKKNGEFTEYCKFHVPKSIEREWSLEVKEKLLDEICSGSNILQVAQLARINLPESEIVDAFNVLSSSPPKDEILNTIELLKPLFEPNLYEQILQLFK